MVSEIDFGHDWVTAISFKMPNGALFYILSVYLPHQCPDNEEEYISKIGILISIVNDLDSPNILIMGDFNAHLGDIPSSFGKILKESCDENEILISSKIFLPANTYTYISERWESSTSWLDHCICTEGAHDSIRNFRVLYNASASDHIPIALEITFDGPLNTLVTPPEVNVIKRVIRWSDLSTEQLLFYIQRTNKLLLEIPSPDDTFNCLDFNCRNPIHIREYSDYYRAIIGALKEASQALSELQRSPICAFPGWNEFVQDSHASSIAAMQQWRHAGMPTQGPIFERKKRCHRQFKADVRRARRNETNFINNKLAEKLVSKNGKHFWKDVNKIMGGARATTTSVNGVSGDQNISEL